MSVILKCGECGDEIVRAGLDGANWLIEPTLGGTRIICSNCQKTDENHLIREEIKTLIEIHVNQARDEAVKKYTPEYVKQLRKEREERPKYGILL